MSILDILRLVGYTTGTLLYIFLVRLLLQRRPKNETAWTTIGLGASTGLWHFGKMLRALYDALGIEKMTLWPRTAEAIAFIGLGLLPSILLHCHLSYLQLLREKRQPSRSIVIMLLVYAPTLMAPLAMIEFFSGSYRPPLQKMAGYIIPFATWDAVALWISAYLSMRVSKLLPHQREGHLFMMLARIWIVIGAAMFITFALGIRRWPALGVYIEESVGLSSILPAALLAYYIYRYHYLEIIIRQSFFYAIFASLIGIVYLYGIRGIDQYAQVHLGTTPGAVELLLILALVFAAGPIGRWIDKKIDQLFASEMGVYRRVAEQISEEAPRFESIPDLIHYAEATVGHELELPSVRVTLTERDTSYPTTQTDALNQLFAMMTQSRARLLDHHPALDQLGATCCVPLWHEDRLVGLMLIEASPSLLTSSKRAALPILAAQIAVAIRNCQLIEEKLRLEQELAERERLAVLGHAAASIAHEVKNPLSAVKTIVQVMQEDEQMQSTYQRDLNLIVKEIDRLNRTVTQLLSFARPSAAAGESVSLLRLVQQAIVLLTPEAEKAGVQLNSEINTDVTLPGSLSTAMAEILTNLTLNAIQASPPGGTVLIAAHIHEDQSKHISLTVMDDGPGITPDIKERMFMPFFTTKQRGTGLGLTIVKRRLTELGGSIEINSPLTGNGGTQIKIILPISGHSVDYRGQNL